MRVRVKEVREALTRVVDDPGEGAVEEAVEKQHRGGTGDCRERGVRARGGDRVRVSLRLRWFRV